jgi:hypothetical protein
MRLKSLAVAAISAGALGLTGFTLPASGSPAASCGTYPAAQCGITFDKASYHRGDTVTFKSDPAFKKAEQVDGKIKCEKNNYHHSVGTFRAHRHVVKGTFTIPKKAPTGSCKLVLTGETSGKKASGSFRVKRG